MSQASFSGGPSTTARPSGLKLLGPLDYLLLLLVSALLLGTCVLNSRGHLMWPDEIYTHELTVGRSMPNMIAAWSKGVDGGGILYYLACRLWLDVVGFSELKLRLFSSLGLITALVVLWTSARRYFSVVPVAFAATLVYFTALSVIWQNFNGRFYGMYLAAASLAAAAFLYTANKKTLTATDLTCVFLAHTLLVGTQVLGVLFSGGIILAMIAFDRLNRRFRPRLYLAATASWLFLVITLHGVLALSAIAKGHFWTLKPAFRNLTAPDFGFNPVAKQCFEGLLLVAIILWLTTGRPRPQHRFVEFLRTNPGYFCSQRCFSPNSSSLPSPESVSPSGRIAILSRCRSVRSFS
jgi:hypothetical protein